MYRVTQPVSLAEDGLLLPQHVEVVENYPRLGCYVASGGNSLPTFREKHIGPTFKGQES
jgi:hypothetical protein